MAQYIDHFLKPIVSRQQSYIKDSFHFLEKICQITLETPQTFLVTCDVENMYTNKDKTIGLKTVAHFFQTYPDIRRPDKEILQLLEVSLKNNDFFFNGNFWLQKSGTAMRKVFAPSYANLFMAKIEEDFFTAIMFPPPILCKVFG